MRSHCALVTRCVGLSAVAAFAVSAGCGFGTGGVIAAVNGSGGGTNAPSSPGPLSVLAPKVSPATIRLVLTDAEGDPAIVQFAYVAPNNPGVEVPLTRLAQNPLLLPSSKDGAVHLLPWDFAHEVGLGDGAFVDGVTLIAHIAGGPTQATAVGLGNDAPVVEVLPIDAEVSGVVPVRLRIHDSSSDAVNVRVEFSVTGDAGAGWRIARPAGIDPGEQTPDFAFRSVAAVREGDDLVFFWDTNSVRGDLQHLERDVQLRFTAIDPVAAAAEITSAAFRVDNNEAPALQLGQELFVDPDDRRGIPIPYTLRDADGDAVRVVFQWRRSSQSSFPALGSNDPDEIARRLLDPTFVREKQICMPFPVQVRGVVSGGSVGQVGLTELRQDQVTALLTRDVEFRRLDLLREATITELTEKWVTNPLARPVAAVPLGEGLTALVLDEVAGTGRVIEVELSTGAVRNASATVLPGSPTAMCMERDEHSVLVASESGGLWRLRRVDAVTGAATPLLESSIGGANGPSGPVRGVLSLGTNAALVTIGNALWRLGWAGGAGTVTKVCGGLASPWGLAQDPLRPMRVLVAERDADRIVTIDPLSREVEIIASRDSADAAVVRPTAIAMLSTGRGPRLAAICETPAGSRRIVGLDLGQSDHRVFSLGEVEADASSIAGGQSGLVLVTAPGHRELLASGGIEQQAELISYDPATALATLRTPLARAARIGQAWRIDVAGSPIQQQRAVSSGSRNVFVWDSRAAGMQEAVFLQVTAMDRDLGETVVTAVPREIGNHEVATIAGASLAGPTGLVPSDIDGDGDLDLVVANLDGGSLSIQLQEGTGVFVPGPVVPTPGPPRDLTVADVDGDGRPDLISTLFGPSGVVVFVQNVDATFSLLASFPAVGVGSVPKVADIDGDGRQDIVFGDSAALYIYFQDSPRVFSLPTRLVGAAQALSIADLDEDGDLDIALAGRGLRAAYQAAPRSFSIATSPGDNDALELVCGDVDGDGDVDIATASQSSVTVMYRADDGAFLPGATIRLSPFINDMSLTDLDGDGDLDITVALSGDSVLTTIYQSSPGSFGAATPMFTGSTPFAIAAADLDGNGHIDLACAVFLEQLVILGCDAGRAVEDHSYSLPLGSWQSAAVLDLDGDGDQDILCAERSSNVGSLIQIAPRQYVSGPRLSMFGTVLAGVVDLDGDLRPDVVKANPIRIYYQQSPFIYSEATIGYPGRNAWPVDLDGDSSIDLLVLDFNGGPADLRAYYQESPRNFVRGADLANGVPISVVTTTDIDSDGDLDIVGKDDATEALILLRCLGGRAYHVESLSIPAEAVTRIEAADIDGDGRMDLVLAKPTALQAFLQDRSGAFHAAPPQTKGLEGVNFLRLVDLDGDGGLDVVLAEPYALRRWYMDYPGGGVVRKSESPGFGTTVLRTVADFDGDGDQDFAFVDGQALRIRYGRGR